MTPSACTCRSYSFSGSVTPPLFIPWSAIGAVTRSMELWMERVRFTVGHPVITTMELPLSAVKGSMFDPASAFDKVPQAS